MQVASANSRLEFTISFKVIHVFNFIYFHLFYSKIMASSDTGWLLQVLLRKKTYKAEVF